MSHRSLPISSDRVRRFPIRVRSSSRSIEKVDEALEKLKTEASRPVDVILDEEAILSKSSFPIKPADLIARAKEVLANLEGSLLLNAGDTDTEAFVFQAPVIGPLDYAEMRDDIKSFKANEAFPVLFPCYHHFWVDPYEPNRVWFTFRPYTKNTGPLMGQPATNKVVDQTPCMHSLVFNEKGKVVKLTIGYAMDRDVGNTGGLGGIFGLVYGAGRPLPVPEGQPYQPSFAFRLSIAVLRFFKKG